MRPIVIALLSCAAACGRDAVSPERAVVIAPVLSARGDTREESGTGSLVDFEDFALGAIDGQHDWTSMGGGAIGTPTAPCAPYDHEIADYDRAVPGQFRSASFGHRSLRISNAVTSGCYSDQTFSSRTVNVAGEAGAWTRSTDGLADYALNGAVRQNHFEAEWMLMSTVPDVLQPGLEVVASPARGDEHRMSWVQMADWSDGLAIVFAERSDTALPGAFERSTVARGLDRRRAHGIKVTMDFVDGPGNDIVRVYVDGVLRHTGTSWETYYARDPNGKANFAGATPAVNRVMFRTGSDLHRGVPGDPAPATSGHGFVIDNVRLATFMVATSAVSCRDGGWRGLRDTSGRRFENQGACVSWVQRAPRSDDRSY